MIALAAESPNLPDPDAAMVWFWGHVVGLPSIVVTVLAICLWVRSWQPVVQSAVVEGPRAVRQAGRAVRSGSRSGLVAMVAAQTGFIAGTYLVAHFFHSMFLREGRQIRPPFDYQEIWRQALLRDHWNAFSVKVVLGAIAFVVIVDFMCLTSRNREQRLALIGSLAAGLAALVVLPGALVLVLALLHAKDYTLGTAGMYAFWAGALYGWSRLVRWSCEFPRLIVDRTPSRVEQR